MTPKQIQSALTLRALRPALQNGKFLDAQACMEWMDKLFAALRITQCRKPRDFIALAMQGDLPAFPVDRSNEWNEPSNPPGTTAHTLFLGRACTRWLDDPAFTADRHHKARATRTWNLRNRLDGSLVTPSGVPYGHIGPVPQYDGMEDQRDAEAVRLYRDERREMGAI